MKNIVIGCLLSLIFITSASAIELSQDVIEKTKNPNNAIIIYRNGDAFVSEDTSLKPILEYISENGSMKGAFVFDKTVGKSEALLYVYGKAKFVYGERMSIEAQKILIRHGIQHKEGKLVGEILTPDNTDVRPCDAAVKNIKKAKAAYTLFTEESGALD